MRSRGRRAPSTASRQPIHTIDLHAHTTASDGLLSPNDLVKLAQANGLRVLAITDHDTTGSVAAALASGTALGVTVVPGIEINTSVDGREIHVLGYFIDYDAPALQDFLAEQQRHREQRASRMIEKLTRYGLALDMAAVRMQAGTASIGRPHVARALVGAGYVRTTQEAFEQWLGNDRPAYVARSALTPNEAVTTIRRFGGLPTLAHPASILDLEVWIQRLVEAGLVGIECYYPGYRPAVTRALLGIAGRYRLVATGGSDFHGADLKNGMPLGGVFVPPETLTELERRRTRQPVRSSM